MRRAKANRLGRPLETEVSGVLHYGTAESFFGVLAAIDDPACVEKFLKEVLTPAEFRDIVLRWRLMEELAAGKSQRTIASELGVSLCKITRGSRILRDRNSVSRRFISGDRG